MDWIKHFDEQRLDRGYNYYLEDKVYDVILTDDTILSKVEGSKSNTYEVKIEFNDDEIISSYCTCPYAYADLNCKHMVATLYKMDEIIQNKEDNVSDKNYDQISNFHNILKNLDEIKLKRFLYDEFKDDKKFVEKFINKFQVEFTPEDFDNYENILDNIFNIDLVELYNENGYYQESPFQRYLENFINNKIKLLYKNKEYEYVLQLLYIIFSNISEKIEVKQYLNVDTILKECIYYLENIIDEVDKVEKDEIFNYISGNIKYEYNPIISNYLIGSCIRKYNSKSYLKQISNFIDQIISDKNKVNEEILLYKYELLNLLDSTENEKITFLKKYKSYDKILDLLIKKEISDKNIDEAIDLLNKNKELNGNLHSLEDTLLLLELYKYNQDNDNIIKTLKSILYEYNIQDFSYIKQLKEIYENNEWLYERNELIQFYEDNYSFEFLNNIYIEEKLFDELFLNLKENCKIEDIEKYREYIEDDHTEDILDIYKRRVLEDAQSAKNISAYTVIIRYLYNMLSYENGEDVVLDLINVLENKYKNKKLFMERLDEIKRNNF